MLRIGDPRLPHQRHDEDGRPVRKMPWTAWTMLVGCLAIIGAGIPLTPIGLSGYFSKDAIIEQVRSRSWRANGVAGRSSSASRLVARP